MFGIANHHALDVLDRLNQVDRTAERGVELPDGAFHFRMSGVADQEHFARFPGIARDFHMHLGDQGTGGVENIQQAALGFLLYHARHAMGAENDGGAIGHLVQFIDEHRADGAQPVHHVLVMNDLMPHVDGCAEQHHRPLNDVDGAVHAGAESARIGQEDLHQFFRLASRKASNNRHAAPTVMAESATLNAGKYARSQ